MSVKHQKIKALMLLGPTASGKTATSLELAKHLPVEIISVDSALVYRGMDIGTAKPSQQERALVPHHLIDIVDIEDSYSAADFRQDALRLIQEIRDRGKFPLIVGGTMLYAKALREGIDMLPSTDSNIREAVSQEAQRLGWSAMHEKLSKIDPLTADRLNPNDSQRIARALEVYAMTGMPLSSFHQGKKVPDSSIAVAAFLPGNRARLHENISLRFDQMLKDGFIEEVQQLMQRPAFNADLSSMRAVGYRQAIDYLLSKVSYDEFVQAGKAATRQLAKRQMTWLRSMQSIALYDPYEISPAIIGERILQWMTPDES